MWSNSNVFDVCDVKPLHHVHTTRFPPLLLNFCSCMEGEGMTLPNSSRKEYQCMWAWGQEGALTFDALITDSCSCITLGYPVADLGIKIEKGN